MISELPSWNVPRLAKPLSWAEIPAMPLVRTEDGSVPEQPTLVRLAWDDEALFVRFECQDRDAWGNYTRRDEPIYEEEVVEVFLAPGDDDPKRYFEIEVSPPGILFDAVIHNTTGRRAGLEIDTSWDCPGLVWRAGQGSERQDWWAEIVLPWEGLVGPTELPRSWRANFYRIERPRVPPDSDAEFSALSPTFARPADFHRPDRFGRLVLADAGDPGKIR